MILTVSPSEDEAGLAVVSRFARKESRRQRRLVPFQPRRGHLEVRCDPAQQAPELRTVRPVPQMRQFVHGDIFQHFPRREDQMPVNEDMAFGPA